jgi:hypothetical protein
LTSGIQLSERLGGRGLILDLRSDDTAARNPNSDQAGDSAGDSSRARIAAGNRTGYSQQWMLADAHERMICR